MPGEDGDRAGHRAGNRKCLAGCSWSQGGEEVPCVCSSAIVLGRDSCHKRGVSKEGRVSTVNSQMEAAMLSFHCTGGSEEAPGTTPGSQRLLNKVTQADEDKVEE